MKNENTYAALNRPLALTTPDAGKTKYSYDKSGMLYSVKVENVRGLTTEIVKTLTYDAKGQRQKIQHENGTTTTYEYDAFTFRVRRIRTTRHSDSKELQDLRYWYDPVGNITLQKDLALQTVYFDGNLAEPHNDYTYDALYRLKLAKGREHAGNNAAPNYNDDSRMGKTPVPVASTDSDKMRRYTQYYEYDAVGNFMQMKHTAGTAPFQNYWTRNFEISGTNNRLEKTKLGAVDETEYDYDARGNLVSGFVHLQSIEYNAENRLEQVVINGNRTAYYQYDSGGQRIRKTIIDSNTNITETRKYVGEWEVYSKTVGSSLDIERETLHISDDAGRIALIDTKTNGSVEQLLRYQYSNHLGSATLELDDVGAIISYEKYYPYGSTSFQSGRSTAEVSLKRYRYTGKERDEESGLYYHGARYYVPWLARWTSVDALQNEMPTWSSYNYGFCNPIIFNDPSGNRPDNLEEYGGKPVQFTQKEVGEDIYNVKLGYNEVTGEHDVELLYERQDATVITGNQSTSWYTDLGFNESGHYRNEYSADGFSDPNNYVRFLDNASGSIWNMGVDIFNSFKNFSLEGLSNEVSASYNYYSKTSNADIWSDTKAGFKSAFSDIRNYENLAPSLLLKMPSSTTTIASFEFKNITTTATQTVLNPKEIHFMQSSIKNTTGEFTVLGNAQALKSGTLNPEILRMNVWQDANSKIWTLDNRRLAAFKLSGLHEAPIQWANPSGQMWKMTTTNKGASIWLKFGGGSGATVR